MADSRGRIPDRAMVQQVLDPRLEGSGVRLLMKRDDLIHEHISGNKWRKLKYNISEAIQQSHHAILTFGGAYSNHIAATAFACRKAGMESIGVIRGEDDRTNPTLTFVRDMGMQLHFVPREEYRKLTRAMQHEDPTVHDMLQEEFGRCFIIPEGGANGLGVRGCAEILAEVNDDFDVVCCAAGTGTTLAGLALTVKEHQQVLGFPALKGGSFLKEEVKRLMTASRLRPPSTVDLQFITDYHFGGYAKVKPVLLEFIKGFSERTLIPLDPIYTGKMMFGMYDIIEKGGFEQGTTILVIHTGGLQGWNGMKHRGLA